MLIIRNNAGLIQFIAEAQKKGQRIGFVPTMGALHGGHLALIQQAAQLTDLVVCSIFVNPTQFNDPSDLEKYPRPITRDIDQLYKGGCSVLFLPGVDDIYPPDLDTTVKVNPGPLGKVMEGEFRPGHFKGVMQVVNRLLNLVQPDILVMGQKDYQQAALIRFMLTKLKSPVELVVASTLRDKDGLAKSSRNVRLTKPWRAVAPLIHQTLLLAKEKLDQENPETLSAICKDQLEAGGLRPEYFRIVDGLTLQTIKDPKNHSLIVACTAAWAGEVRLIDNEILKA